MSEQVLVTVLKQIIVKKGNKHIYLGIININ